MLNKKYSLTNSQGQEYYDNGPPWSFTVAVTFLKPESWVVCNNFLLTFLFFFRVGVAKVE